MEFIISISNSEEGFKMIFKMRFQIEILLWKIFVERVDKVNDLWNEQI